MQKRMKYTCRQNIKKLVFDHIGSNINLYIKITTIFIIGICIGTAIVNKLPDTEAKKISEYMNNSISLLKNESEISKLQILKTSICKNIVIVLAIWFFALTIIGNFILYIITLFLGITFAYTISAIMTCFSIGQGILFFLATMLLQNVIYIPSMLFLIVQGLRTYQNLVSRQNKNLKFVLIKYSAYSILVIIFLIISSLIEVYVSGSLVYTIVKYL